MLPSLDVRFKNMIKAIQEVIGPALPPDEKLAQEQARLIVGHLAMLKEQWKNAVRFEAGSFRLMRELAENLLPHVDSDQAGLLSRALEETAGTDRVDIDALNAAICSIGHAVDKVILGEDGKKRLSRGAWDTILEFGEKDALRNRVWFKGNGIDPDRESLPALEEVI